MTRVSAPHVLLPRGPACNWHPAPRSRRTLTLELLPGASQQLVEDVEATLVLSLADGPRLLQQVWAGAESRCRRGGDPLGTVPPPLMER